MIPPPIPIMPAKNPINAPEGSDQQADPENLFIEFRRDLQGGPEKSGGNGSDRKREQQPQPEMPCPVISDKCNRRDKQVQDQRRWFHQYHIDAEQGHQSQISAGTPMAYR